MTLNLDFAFAQQTLEEKKLNDIHAETYRKRNSIGVLFKKYFLEIKSVSDISEKEKIQKKIDELDLINEINNAKELELDFDFVSQNLSSKIALDILKFKVSRKESVKFYEKFNFLFNSLSTELKESAVGIELKEKLKNFKISRIGNSAVNFEVKDINNDDLSLKSFQEKKYILLDFWASWCAPCREDFPFLKELYAKYNIKGLEIINISRDENLEMWKKAVEKDRIGIWKHFSIKENKSLIEEQYFVTAIPVKILIDKSGKIIGRWRSGGEENKKEIKEMLEKILE